MACVRRDSNHSKHDAGVVVASAVAELAVTEFEDVKTEAQFTAVLKAKVESGILPAPLLPGMMDFYNNYKQAVLGSGVPGADEALVASVMGSIADRHGLRLCIHDILLQGRRNNECCHYILCW